MNKYDIVVGENYFVKDSNNNYREAQIISIRPSKKNEYEYYVHYIDLDKRLDEWISQENIDTNSRYETNMENANNKDASRFTRWQKRKYDEIYKESPQDTSQEISKLEKEYQEHTRVKNIDKIRIGDYEIDTWYFSPYPDEYKRVHRLFICEFCLKYMKIEGTFNTHRSYCTKIHPPGLEIYQKDQLVVYEIDGTTNKLYCQNLCLLAKLFLDHKTIYYDVTPFMFYVLCITNDDNDGYHIVGYFSKEKTSIEKNNLACILTLPPFQGQGYGKFLISFSYELSKLEGVIGGPEKPLSDLGWRGYLCYWEQVVMDYLYNKLLDNTTASSVDLNNNNGGSSNQDLLVTISEISEATCINVVDIKSALEYGTRKLMKFFDKTTSSLLIGKQSLLSIHNKDNREQKSLQNESYNQSSNVSRRSLNNVSSKSGKPIYNMTESTHGGSICVGGVDVRKLNWKPPTKQTNKRENEEVKGL